MLASELYARSQGDRRFDGKEHCHWCGGRCTRAHINDDEPIRPFVKNKHMARCPANPWVCIGCYLWRRPRVTITWMDEIEYADRKGVKHKKHAQQDNQPVQWQSWFVTPEKALAVDKWRHKELLYGMLLKPPPLFFLSFHVQGYPLPNFLHCCVTNELGDVKMGSELTFTINNVPFTWTPYELEQSLRNGASGKMPGSAELIRLLGDHELPALPIHESTIKGGVGGKAPPLPEGKELKKSVGK